ncbi:hypothetical protein CEXT_309761 [Caerostris extrusa]|uniref:Uncharacterized protein n=1 Tax=Caerostris extrusa TaxID=172846 RepID=A0AAV4NF86_CAEEX|nr:hypothetical protein CEXT_309761 [Caerostris extrusa]
MSKDSRVVVEQSVFQSQALFYHLPYSKIISSNTEITSMKTFQISLPIFPQRSDPHLPIQYFDVAYSTNGRERSLAEIS